MGFNCAIYAVRGRAGGDRVDGVWGLGGADVDVGGRERPPLMVRAQGGWVGIVSLFQKIILVFSFLFICVRCKGSVFKVMVFCMVLVDN